MLPPVPLSWPPCVAAASHLASAPRSILAALLLHVALVLPTLGPRFLVTGLARLFHVPRVLAGVTAIVPPVHALRLRMGGRRVGADCERETYRSERGQCAYHPQVCHRHVPSTRQRNRIPRPRATQSGVSASRIE